MVELDRDTVEYRFRRDMRERFRSQQEAAAVLQIPLFRIKKAYRGDLDVLTCGDWWKLRHIVSPCVRADLAHRYFGVR